MTISHHRVVWSWATAATGRPIPGRTSTSSAGYLLWFHRSRRCCSSHWSHHHVSRRHIFHAFVCSPQLWLVTTSIIILGVALHTQTYKHTHPNMCGDCSSSANQLFMDNILLHVCLCHCLHLIGWMDGRILAGTSGKCSLLMVCRKHSFIFSLLSLYRNVITIVIVIIIIPTDQQKKVFNTSFSPSGTFITSLTAPLVELSPLRLMNVFING